MTKYNIRLTTPEDMHLQPYRYSMLNEVATCPTLAALEYGYTGTESARDDNAPRNIPTDAGAACHRVFAALRFYRARQMMTVGGFGLTGKRLFGETEFEQMVDVLNKAKARDDAPRMHEMAFCMEALYTSGFYDDPSDRNRTIANLEQVCASYIDRWDNGRAQVFLDSGEPAIELTFDIVIEADDGWAARFIGTIDALHYSLDVRTEIVVHENKTGRYINDAWAAAFLMSHQVTGYCVAASALTGQQVRRALILGSQIPLNANCPVRTEVVARTEMHIEQWLTWFRHCVYMYEMAKLNPIVAPKYSHSCNRYFAKCQFLPFCDGDLETKQEIIRRLEERTTP